MSTVIYYDDFPVFSGICPTPIVGRGETFERNGRRWANVETISLEGSLTGCGGLNRMLQLQSGILNGFGRNYQKLSIEDNGQQVFLSDIARVESINFEDSNYAYKVPFTINLKCYPSGFFSGVYGVLDPVNQFSFNEQPDQSVNFTHKVSARGFNTDLSNSNALQNAINFCISNSGIDNAVSPNFISNSNFSNSILQTTSLSIDRFQGTCSLDESWIYDPVLGGNGILRYSTDFNSGNIEGVTSASLKGSLQGGENVSISDLRSRFVTLDIFDLASNEYNNFFTGDLNEVPLQVEISDNANEKTISFTYSFDDDPRPNPSFEDNFSMGLNEINGVKTANLDVKFKWKGNCKCNNGHGWEQIKNAANNFNYFQLASEKNAYYNNGTFLKRSPVGSGISENKNNCELTVSMQYEHLDISLIPPEPLQDFNYTLNVTPALPKYSAKPTICSGHYSIYDLNYHNRAQFTIQGDALIKSCGNLLSGESVTKCMVEQLASKYVSGEDIVIVNQSFQKNLEPEKRGISFSYSWTSKIDPIFPNDVLYV